MLMEDVPGEALKKLVKNKRAGTGEMRLFAAALAKLHRCPFVFGDPFRVEDHLAIRCAGLHEPLAEAFSSLARAFDGSSKRPKSWRSAAMR